MALINHTPFPALGFAGIDPNGQRFHVVVLRQTLTWDASGALHYTAAQAPLCVADQYVGAVNASAVVQESDLCHYKPRCDVLVVGNAYAPADSAAPAWLVRLALRSAHSDPPAYLVHKTLRVTGPRAFVRRPAAVALLGALGPCPWVLTDPEPARCVPLRDDYAYGGGCRLDADDPFADRVAPADRLTPAQLAGHPDATAPPSHQPVAHVVCVANPLGRGFLVPWYLKATGLRTLPAPQIESPQRPITAARFAQLLTDPAADSDPADWVAGLGVRAKAHPARRRLAGTVDAAFAASPAALPADFDFAFWNAAPPDQQCAFPRGDEIIELGNLAPPDTPGLRRDAQGHGWLQLCLPGHLPYVLVRYANGALGELPAQLDTLHIDCEQRRVSCVWRATLAATPAVRQLEARLLTAAPPSGAP